MPTPQPSLYDISPIPIFPYTPGLWSWVIVGALAVLLFVVSQFLSRFKKRYSVERSLDLTLRELEILKSLLAQAAGKDSAATRNQISKIALLLRRYLSVRLEAAPLSEMSAREIRNFAEQCKDELIRKIIYKIVTLEEMRFRPDQDLSHFDLSIVSELMTDFRALQ